MNEVDKAIDSVEQHDLYGQREVPIAHARALTAEVRRLRAMLEPTPDARGYKPSAYELVEILLQIPSKPRTSGIFDLEAMAARIQQDRARLLDEAAERGVRKLLKLLCATPVKPWIEGKEELRDAIKGLAE